MKPTLKSSQVPEWRVGAPAGVSLASLQPASSQTISREGGAELVARSSQGVPAFWFARGIEVGTYDGLHDPYNNSAWVQRAIKKISQPISSIEVEFTSGMVMKGGKSKKRRYTARGVTRSEDAEVELPQFRELMRSPMPGFTWSDFVEASVGWLKMRECFWLLSDETLVPFPEARAGAIPPVQIANPDRMRHVIENGELVGWVYIAPSGKAWTLLPEQVIQLKYWNPYNAWRGCGEYQSAQIAAESDYLAGKFARNLMANNGDTGPYIVAKSGVPNEPQREQIISDLRAKRNAQLRGEFKPMFLTGDIEVTDPAVRSVDASYIAGRIENRHEIAIAFGVPPSMFDVKAAFSIGSSSDYYQLIMDTCIPTGAKLCDALEQLIFKTTGQRVTVSLDWDEHPVLQAVRRERIASADTLWAKGMPMSSINDYLALGIEEFEGWDIGYLPIGVIPAGMEAYDQGSDDYAENPNGDQAPADPANPVQEALHALRRKMGTEAGPITKGESRKKQLWDAHMRQRSKSVRQIGSRASRVIYDARKRTLRKLADYAAVTGKGVPLKTRGLLDIIFDKRDFASAMVDALKPALHATLDAAGQELMEEIGKANPKDPWKTPPADALKFIQERENKIAGVSDAVHSQLKTALEAATEEGEGIDDITERVSQVFNNLGKFESRRIAMTETGAAYGFSRDNAMRRAGVRYKTWLTSRGPNVRPAHAAAEIEYEANPIPVDEPFIVGGEALMHPCDPSGSPGNVINCQCVQLAAEPPEEPQT